LKYYWNKLKNLIKRYKLRFGLGSLFVVLLAKRGFLIVFGSMFLEDILSMHLGSTGITVSKVLWMFGTSLLLWWILEKVRR